MKKRLLTLLLTAGLIISSVPAAGAAAKESREDEAFGQRKLVASYDMSHDGEQSQMTKY